MARIEREYPAANRRNDDLFTLYVTNLPVELNKDGVAQIFQAFGVIQHIISPVGASWAYVSYKTCKEAESAISSLNDCGPLFLKVAYQRKKTQQKIHHYNPEVAEPPEEIFCKDFRYARNGVSPNVNGRNFTPGVLAENLNRYANYNSDQESNSIYPNDVDHNMYNPFESVGRYADTNAMWSRGCVNIDDYGKRFVSMGRGFTRYHIPEPHLHLEHQIGAVYNKRRAGLYAYDVDRLKPGLGKCLFCAHMTTLQCEQCAGYYCSRDCQRADWPRHKKECKTIPDLVSGGLGMAGLSHSSSDEQLQDARKRVVVDLYPRSGGLRRPKAAAQAIHGKAVDRDHRDEEMIPPFGVSSLEGGPRIDVTPQESPSKEKQPISTIDLAQLARNSPQNFEYNKEMQQRSIGPRRNARQQPDGRNEQNGGFRNDRKHGGNQYRENNNNNRPPNDSRSFHSSRGGSHSSTSGSKESTGMRGSMSDKTRSDLMKMEEELGFEKDPRAEANVIKQAPLIAPPSENVVEKTLTSETVVEKIPTVETVLEKIPTIEAVVEKAEEIKIVVNKAAEIEALIPKTDFTDVIVVFATQDGSFWAQRKRDIAAIEKMMIELQTLAQSAPRVKDLVVGEIYAVKYNEIWHRASLVSKDPPRVFYVDFGNEEPPQCEDFRPLNNFPKRPAYAIKMRFSEDSATKKVAEEAILSVRMVNFASDGVLEVADDAKVEKARSTVSSIAKNPADLLTDALSPKVLNPEPEIPAAEEFPAAKVAEIASGKPRATEKLENRMPSTVDSLEVDGTGYIQVYMALSNDSYAICVLNDVFAAEYEMVYEKLTESCEAINEPANFEPRVGDFVCGCRDGFWLRGFVFSRGPPIRLALVDEARVTAVDKVLPMPAEYTNICSFGSICQFEGNGHKFNPEENCEFTVAAVRTVDQERVVRALLKSPERLKNVAITLRNWTPTPEQKGIGFAQLKSHSEVCITAYSSERIMFVRSLDEASLERSMRITQDVAKWAQKAPTLDGPPAIGQLVIAKFTDGNFYRAIVTKVQDGKIGVSYVDYGNRDFTTIDQLRVLSDELKEERSCAAKVVLKDIKSDVPPTKEVHEYLNLLVGKEQPLVCTFDGIPSKDGVTMTTATGECVNNKINEYLTPTWQREDPSKNTKCFTMVDLEYAKLGNVGETVKALVLYGNETALKYFMCPYDADLISHVTFTMPKMLQEYCESTKVHYIPRIAELCLAVYEGAWYRGLCLKQSQTPTEALIHFIDFGNMEVVDHKNIREITKDFMSPAALACICDVKNLGVELVNGEVPENIRTKLDALIPLNEMVEVKIVKKIEDGEYEIELPQVRQKLVEEGLAK